MATQYYTASTLGGGSPLFPRVVTDGQLRLTAVGEPGNGFVELRYAVGRARSSGRGAGA